MEKGNKGVNTERLTIRRVTTLRRIARGASTLRRVKIQRGVNTEKGKEGCQHGEW